MQIKNKPLVLLKIKAVFFHLILSLSAGVREFALKRAYIVQSVRNGKFAHSHISRSRSGSPDAISRYFPLIVRASQLRILENKKRKNPHYFINCLILS